MTKSRNLTSKIGLALVVAFFLLCWAVVGDAGSVAGGLIETIGVPGTILLYTTMGFTFATIYIAARRAHRAQSWFWFLGVIFIWPLSYVYTLAVNRDDE
jgi:hypothetical protein